MNENNTIAAIATPYGRSGIGIIRISGETAIETADKIFRQEGRKGILSRAKSHTMHLGYITDGKEDIDQVLVSVMRGPGSYTGEDVVEINCHGGMTVLGKVLELCVAAGARIAENGEFSKRAFLNGRMDLSQAEAVMDLINAGNDMAVRSSMSQLKGSVSEAIKEIREEILYNIAFIEAALDDPEHISLEGYKTKIAGVTDECIEKISKLIESYKEGRIVKEGIRTVILGKPNAGKSSLLNLLLGEDRAIVTDIAGTTRDTLEENINLGGISLNITDTAGIRQTGDTIEKIGVDRAKDCAKMGDLVLFVADGSRALDEDDMEILDIIKEKKALILVNKSDIETIIDIDELKKRSGRDVIIFSAKTGEGKDLLCEKIKNMFFSGDIEPGVDVCITNERHKEALNRALESLIQVKTSIGDNMPEDFYSIDLMDAYRHLGTITGESIEDDVADKIFEEFCMGK